MNARLVVDMHALEGADTILYIRCVCSTLHSPVTVRQIWILVLDHYLPLPATCGTYASCISALVNRVAIFRHELGAQHTHNALSRCFFQARGQPSPSLAHPSVLFFVRSIMKTKKGDPVFFSDKNSEWAFLVLSKSQDQSAEFVLGKWPKTSRIFRLIASNRVKSRQNVPPARRLLCRGGHFGSQLRCSMTKPSHTSLPVDRCATRSHQPVKWFDKTFQSSTVPKMIPGRWGT